MFNLPGGRFAFLTPVRYATEYKSKPARSILFTKINGIISLKQKKSNFTAKMYGVQSHKNMAGAMYSSGTVMADVVF